LDAEYEYYNLLQPREIISFIYKAYMYRVLFPPRVMSKGYGGETQEREKKSQSRRMSKNIIL